MRQGTHQLAQKSTRTYLPWKSARETLFPKVSACVKGSAVRPIPVSLSVLMLCSMALIGTLFLACGLACCNSSSREARSSPLRKVKNIGYTIAGLFLCFSTKLLSSVACSVFLLSISLRNVAI
ncbi:hypothetical protein D3C81_1147760 [compost metagenome]